MFQTHEQLCHVCNEAGTLMMCDTDTCILAYHHYCVDLPGVPDGDWFCPECLKRQYDEVRRVSYTST